MKVGDIILITISIRVFQTDIDQAQALVRQETKKNE